MISKQNPSALFFETLTVQIAVMYIFKLVFNRSIFGLCFKKKTVYYIDASFVMRLVIIPLLNVFRLRVRQVNFKMMDIKDDSGELVRIRIPRLDLFSVREEIMCSNEFIFMNSKNNYSSQGYLVEYISKALVGSLIHDKASPARVVFLIEVIAWYMKKIKCEYALFVVRNRPWFSVYQRIAEKKGIALVGVNLAGVGFSEILNVIRSHSLLYRIARNIRYRKSYTPPANKNCSGYKMHVDGRGDLDLSNSGENSDFFWLLNSNFPNDAVIYECETKGEYECLVKNDICVTGKRIGKIALSNDNDEFNLISSIFGHYSKNQSIIQRKVGSYYVEKSRWKNYFVDNNVKIYFTWFKYYENHIAIYDALNECSGITAIWQMAFDGYANIENKVIADLLFMYSDFSNDIELKVSSIINYKIIVGYPKDYLAPLLKDRANKLREKLMMNGAKKIICVIDENSLDDSRWHTGHELQQDNYRYVLEKVLEVPWLGVVFKPKTAKTLYKRLGPVLALLDEAVKTGRCSIYDQSGKHTTKESPLLAALSSDICIHGHFCAGTSALECALEGIPTIMIDREGTPFSKLNELPTGKVVFSDWSSAIASVMAHFNSAEGIEGFGDWSSVIDDLDPFRDGKAAYRMGTYLHWLMQGYEKGQDKDQIMYDAAERYKKEWGEDKVIYG